MPITVQFVTNRALTGPVENWQSYGDQLVAPSSPGSVLYGTAFVDEVNLNADTVGAITNIQNVTTGQFSAQALGDLGQAGRNLLIFIHGFDNSFENAITRAAFNREWLAQTGIPAADTSVVAFSWPSEGRLLALPLLAQPYRSDQIAAGQSAVHVMSFFANLKPIADQVHAQGRRVFLLVHSMGNWALQAALESWFSHGNGAATLFDEVFLAAADENYDSFDYPRLGRLSGLSQLTRHTSILFSTSDAVLGVSAFLNGVRRLGQDGPYARFSMDHFPPNQYTMVDCGDYRDFDFGFASSHQYYRRSPTVRSLIAAAMAR
jgi:esterase/lipase superfamily enzyme